MFYLISILSAMTIISIFNIIFSSMPFYHVIVTVIIYTVAVILVDGLFALIIRRILPVKWFSADKKIFDVSKKECRFYEKLGIKKWKDKVLELGVFTGFSKKKVANPNDVEYLNRFLLESNFGVVIHFVGLFVGYLILLIYPGYRLIIGVPVASVNFILNLLPLFILRYNTPRLKLLIKRNTRLNSRIKEEI